MTIVFLSTLAGGLLLVLAACRMDQISWKFPRLVAMISLALIALALTSYVVNAGSSADHWAWMAMICSCVAGAAAVVVLGLAPLASRFGGGMRATAAAGGVVGIMASWAWGFHLGIWPDGVRASAPALAGQALAAVLTGAVTLSMLLGHAYLTQPTMTIQPLRRLVRLFAAAMVLRLTWSLLVGAICWYSLARGTLPPEIIHEQRLVLILRGAVGLLIPAIFAYMVLETVRLRATQSATGILYFTLVLIYVGELTSQYLVRETGVPF